jgi:hypothetical protein
VTGSSQSNLNLSLTWKASVSDQPPSRRSYRYQSMHSDLAGSESRRLNYVAPSERPPAIEPRSRCALRRVSVMPQKVSPGMATGITLMPGDAKIWKGQSKAWGAAGCDVSKSIDQNEVIVAFTWSWTTTHTFTLKRSLRNNRRFNPQKPVVHDERPPHMAQDSISQGD